MELSLLLAMQIGKMFFMILCGYLIVKGKIMKVEESKVLSTLALYVIAPCAVFSSFQIEFTTDKLLGLGVSFLGAIIVNLFFILVAKLLEKPLHLSSIEKASIGYPNAGNLIIPLVSSILGKEWVLYTSGYMVIQTILIWTHCKSLVSEEPKMDIKKIFTNINMIAIIAGIITFLFKIPLPEFIKESIDSIGGCIGPVCMIVIGMLIGSMNIKEIFMSKRAYMICLLRLIILPLCVIVLFKVTNLMSLHHDANQILLITFLAASAPCAATITQFAQLYDKQPQYASLINVLSVIFCIITMPIMLMVMQMFL